MNAYIIDLAHHFQIFNADRVIELLLLFTINPMIFEKFWSMFFTITSDLSFALQNVHAASASKEPKGCKSEDSLGMTQAGFLHWVGGSSCSTSKVLISRFG